MGKCPRCGHKLSGYKEETCPKCQLKLSFTDREYTDETINDQVRYITTKKNEIMAGVGMAILVVGLMVWLTIFRLFSTDAVLLESAAGNNLLEDVMNKLQGVTIAYVAFGALLIVWALLLLVRKNKKKDRAMATAFLAVAGVLCISGAFDINKKVNATFGDDMWRQYFAAETITFGGEEVPSIYKITGKQDLVSVKEEKEGCVLEEKNVALMACLSLTYKKDFDGKEMSNYHEELIMTYDYLPMYVDFEDGATELLVKNKPDGGIYYVIRVRDGVVMYGYGAGSYEEVLKDNQGEGEE